MNITFEEADKIREALKPGADPETRYQAIAILDVAEQKQRIKNEKSMAFIQSKRKENRLYARPKKCWIITFDLPEGKKHFERVGNIDEVLEKLKKEYPGYKAIKYRIKTFK
jgi:hypothetical protein